MAFITLKGNRESLTENAEAYKNKIVEYMNARGFILIGNSSVDGNLSDLTFKRPYTEGDKETRIEAKFTELSLYDKDFTREFGIYFNNYMKLNDKQKFRLYLFIKRCKSPNNWKVVFEETKGYEEKIKEFMDKIENSLEGEDKKAFKKFSLGDLISFINEVIVVEGDYGQLSLNLDNLKETYDVNKSLLDDAPKIKTVPETLMGNLVKVSQLPQKIWISDTTLFTDNDEFWSIAIKESAFLYKNKIYSLEKPVSSKRLSNFVDSQSSKEIEVAKLPEEFKSKILCYLIKGYIISKGIGLGLNYNSIVNCLYLPHKTNKTDKINKRKFLKVYKKDGKINYVKHDGLKIDTKYLDGDYYAIFDLVLFFTNENEEVIEGKSSKKLHYRFTQRYTFNNTEKSKLLSCIKMFQFKNKTFSNAPIIYFSDPITLKIKVSYDGGEQFDSDLFKYIEGDEDDI